MMKKGTEKIYLGAGFTVYLQNLPKKQLETHTHKEAHLFIPIEGHLEVDNKAIVANAAEGTCFR